MGAAFLQPDGSLSPKAISDGVHPTLPGYEIFTASIWQSLLALAADG
jgi:hypothetical protein